MSQIRRIPIDELEAYAQKLADYGEKENADEAMVLTHLISSLRANAERDLLMAQMSARFDQLERSFVSECDIHAAAYQALISEFRALQKQQSELHENQLKIAAIVDAGVAKISAITDKIENLSESVKDVTEP